MREKLLFPFGFKGHHIDELWQAIPYIQTENASAAVPSTQSVLWSDSNVFAAFSPFESNELMLKVTKQALKLLEGCTFERPDAIISPLIPELCRYADVITGKRVKKTFVLNALVGVDLALWSVYATENGIMSFDGIIPDYAKPAMSFRHSGLAQIPLLSYGVDAAKITETLENGSSILKIKIGNTVDATSKEADMRSMLEWDKNRLSQIHAIASGYETPLTKNGKVAYYLDANGRYDTLDRISELLDYADKNGFLDNIALLEEPFDEDNRLRVDSLPITVNADESAHSLEDVKERLALGYKAVALKPIAKTLSVSFAMVAAVHAAGGQCLCADLTVNPLLAEWNKQFAARVSPLVAMKSGCVEVNGDWNYQSWEEHKKLLPRGMEYTESKNGVFCCDAGFYAKSGLLFSKNGYTI